MVFQQKILQFFLFFDIYGQPVEFYINTQTRVKSKIGSLISIMILAFCSYTFFDNLKSWKEKKFLQTITADETITLDQLIKTSKNHSFTFDSSNYYLYFLVKASVNGTSLYNNNLKKYFNQSIIYEKVDGSFQNLELESCYQKKINDFLLMGNEGLTSNDQKSGNRFCIKDGQNINMGLYKNPTKNTLLMPRLVYKLTKCTNSTINGFLCASNQEIDQVLKNIQIQISLPKSFYDFTDSFQPRKRAYDARLYNLDPLFCKKFSVSLIPTNLITDYGWFVDDYRLESTDFNTEPLEYESLNIDSELLFFQYDFRISFNHKSYHRKDQKIYDLIANLGGMVNIVFLLGKLLVETYNALILKYLLINYSFSNLDNKEEKRFLFFIIFTIFLLVMFSQTMMKRKPLVFLCSQCFVRI